MRLRSRIAALPKPSPFFAGAWAPAQLVSRQRDEASGTEVCTRRTRRKAILPVRVAPERKLAPYTAKRAVRPQAERRRLHGSSTVRFLDRA